MKNKKENIKEAKIEKVIYAFLMFLPLMFLLVECLVAIFNKNITPETGTLDIAINNLFNTLFFNWVNNTAIYTTMAETTEILGITDVLFPSMLTYWLITSVVYYLYDIVLMMLNIVHKKIHQLQDSF